MEEKSSIRAKLFDIAKEPNKQLNTQNALIVARIVKFDFPREWPSVFDDIIHLMSAAYTQNNLIELNNLLNIVNQIVKLLSTSKFGAGRKGFLEMAPKLMDTSNALYLDLITKYFAERDLATFEVAYLALKVSGKVLADGFSEFHKAPEAVRFFEETVVHFKGFSETGNFEDSKFIKRLTKIHLNTLKTQPVSFVLMEGALPLIRLYLQIIHDKAALLQNIGLNDDDDTEVQKTELWEKVVVQGLLLLKEIIALFYKNGVSTIRFRNEEEKQNSKSAFDKLKSQFFTPSIITSLVEMLLGSYFRLTPRDLESWKLDPEEWVFEMMNDAWEFQARPCAEKVFADLLANFKEIVGPLVLSFMESTGGSQDLLQRDVAYNAFALASSTPFDNIDFTQLMMSTFIPEGQKTDNELYRIIRRRISIVVSDWVGVQCTDEGRVQVYKLLAGFMNPKDSLNDKVVKMYACEALRYTLDDWNTNINDFLPYLPTFLENIFGLLTVELKSMEAKKFVLQVLSVIVDRVEGQIAAYAGLILQILMPLWELDEENFQMKGTILQTLASLVSATGVNSTQCYPLAFPMLKVSIDKQSSAYAYLCEDALPLWENLVENAPAANQELLELVPALMQLLESNTESLTVEMKILESYVLLDAQFVMNHIGQPMFELFAKYLEFLNMDSVTWVLGSLNLIATALPFDAYAQQLHSSNLFTALLELLFNKDTSPITAVHILCFFSRLVYHSNTMFLQLLDSTNSSAYASQPIVGMLMDIWLDRFDNMGHPKDRKVNSLGLTSLVQTHHPQILQRLPDILALFTQILDEVNEDAVGDAQIYYTSDEQYESSVRDEVPDTMPELERKKELSKKDPVHAIRLKDYLGQCLNGLTPDVVGHLNEGLVDTLSGMLKY